MIKKYTLYIIKFILLVLLQVLILDNFLLFGYINPYVYIIFILFLPTSINRSVLLIVAFILGICIDLFNDTGGVHAAATLIIAFVRPFILRLSFGLSYDYNTLKIAKADFKSQFLYITIMIAIHHIFLFSFEYFSLDFFIKIVKNTVLSLVVTEIFIIILMKLFNYK